MATASLSVPDTHKDVPESTAETDSAVVETEPDNNSKLRTFLGILRRFIGVSDLASIRFSLPAHLLEPTPNLEYWTYLDRPETFSSMGDSADPTGRMLGVLRFWFTKDLKYVKGKPCKPYNSTLGEFFRCNWEVEDNLPELRHPNSEPASSATSVSSYKSSSAAKSGNKLKISYLTEQTSHHPPVSAWVVECAEKNIIAKGYDQIAAKFTGTSVRVTAGDHNHGIFVDLRNWAEEYQLTHPAAHLGGLLRGSLTISVTEHCYVTCPSTKMKAIINYLEDGWLSRAQNRVEGAIFSYDPENDSIMRLKGVPEKDIIARIEGSWVDKMYYTLGNQPFASSAEKHLIIDLEPLYPATKAVPPLEDQLPNESRKFWGGVTKAIKARQYSLATQLKHAIEDRQRAKAAERKEKGSEWRPRFFTGALTPVGRPELTTDGERALRGLREDDFKLEENEEYGA